ncbi:MAG TPA: C4-dicarboxylate ABC transporter, partial [Arthrobacter sp.]
MISTEQQTAAPEGDSREHSPKPRPRRRILLIAAAGFALLSLVAIVLGGNLFTPAATTDSEPTMTATQIVPLVVLVVMFIVATKWPLNIGVMGLVASFG